MECPFCHAELPPETPCLAHPPIPMCYWPHRAVVAEGTPLDEVAKPGKAIAKGREGI